MEKKYCIADLNMEFHLDGDEFFEQHLAPYEISDDSESDIVINIGVATGEIPKPVSSLVKVGDDVYYSRENGCDSLIYHDSLSGRIVAKICYAHDYRRADITLCNMKKIYGMEAKLFVFNVMNNCLTYLIQMHGGFVFHSSTICHDGSGVAFSAVSGTGKSTHTALWIREFEDTFIINDDTPIIRSVGGKAYIYGTPWAGTTGINVNVKLPLKAVVFLARGKENAIQRIPFAMCMNDFFKGVRTPLSDEMMQNLISEADAVFSKVPVYRLHCNMDPQAAHVARDCIYK